ncbi:hypothetical protein [Rhodanobacter sp. L36]|uniref:hypothetical protein n=1 Tax=Rhodanobacter sp. L36 TaxID=1747221 RepID=UPI00131BA14A|nr:hypothetical protein [Rhodanobacter sp. L36]
MGLACVSHPPHLSSHDAATNATLADQILIGLRDVSTVVAEQSLLPSEQGLQLRMIDKMRHDPQWSQQAGQRDVGSGELIADIKLCVSSLRAIGINACSG